MKSFPVVVRFTCPACEQPIESPESDARAGVKCPGCGTGFVPDRLERSEAAPARVDYHSMKLGKVPTLGTLRPDYDASCKVEGIEGNARWVSFFSKLFGVIAVLILAGVVMFGMMDAQELSWTAGAVGAGFLTLAIWLQLLAQLLHIRAALERRG